LLDYFAGGRLEEDVFAEVVSGLTEACRAAGCALLGGETAEMPGLYGLGDYDLAGFVIGVVEPADLPNTETVAPGDILMALPSSGLHTNGFSLVRKVFEDVSLDHVFPALGRPLGEVLLVPHRSYLREMAALRGEWKVAAHVTGGGLLENVPRCLPENLAARFDRSTWRVPAIFQLIAERGRVDLDEMFGTFNMGIGMVLVMSPEAAARAEGEGLVRVGDVGVRRGPQRVILS
jgi:phosphoribosylformylglycinamidine cyclo-ligase